MKGKFLISGARVVSPADSLDGMFDILVADGKISAIAPAGTIPAEGCRVIDAMGMVAAPALVDIHVHLRDPGFTHKEDIISGCAAAKAGGFSAVVSMPNTLPPTDTPELVEYVRTKAQGCTVYPSACITVGMAGKELCNFAELKAAGAVAVTDDGKPVSDRELMKKAVIEAVKHGLTIISHCEDLAIINGGKINKGRVSELLGVPGMDRLSEDSITQREIDIAEETGCPVHIAHVSTVGAVEAIRKAKARGVAVTAETAPHYLTFTEVELMTKNANFRMNPPLREEADVEAVTEALCDGTLDIIATDHAPHSPEEKADFLSAPNGIIGLESSFAASYTALVATGKMTLSQLIYRMSTAPAKIIGIDAGTLRTGAKADIVLIDTAADRIFSTDELRSRSVNCPFIGKRLLGKITRLDF
ncbi:MAG: dihydroorotase [Oscillospiraceae bacterium]|nr:dihydroorotase [Oscillospiraceae bacterium]